MCHSNSNSNRHPNGYSDANAYGLLAPDYYPDADSHCDTNANSDSHKDTDTYSHEHASRWMRNVRPILIAKFV